MRILPALLLLGAVGCGDNLSGTGQGEQLVGGSENCATDVGVSSSGATVSVSIDEGFNAWKNQNAPSVTLTGSSSTCSGTQQFSVSAAGTWSFEPGNMQCSTSYVGTADLA